MALSGFICHDDYLAKLAKLTDEEVGRLFRALMAYHATGEEKEITGREWLAFDFIREDIDRAEKAHEEKCRKNRENRLCAIEQQPSTDDNERQRSSTDVNDGERSTTYKDKDKEKDNDKDNNKRERRTFTPPTVEEVAAYCKERNNGIDAEYFVAYYENRKWELSNGKKMANWHLAIVTWEKNGFNKSGSQPIKTIPAQQYGQRDYSGEQADAMRRMLGKIPPAQRFTQRDYSHEDADAIERMLAMDDGKGAAG